MPYAVASMPQTLLAVTQHGVAVENAVIGQLGAGGAGGVHVPLTLKPHWLVAALTQQASGVTPKFVPGAVQVFDPHVTPALPPPPPAAAPLPALGADEPPLFAELPAIVVDPVAAVPLLGGGSFELLPHAPTRTLNIGPASHNHRAFIFANSHSRG